MPVYTVHGRLMANGRADPERLKFVRDGFNLWAALFGPLWFLAQRLWVGLLIDIVALAIIAVAMTVLRVDAESRMLVGLLVMLLTGFEAGSLMRWSYSRRAWRMLDVVVAKNRDEAEHRFFERWNDGRSPAIDRGAPPPVRPSAPASSGFGEIMGLFPQPRTPR